jgi:formate hydrogenlyase subunit 6/NADH:ubiquinone oxidoreductase subunit I
MTKEMLPAIDLQRCDLCGACVDGCPEEALIMTEQGPAFSSPISCTYCMECEQLCPVSAIRAPLIITWAEEK